MSILLFFKHKVMLNASFDDDDDDDDDDRGNDDVREHHRDNDNFINIHVTRLILKYLHSFLLPAFFLQEQIC